MRPDLRPSIRTGRQLRPLPVMMASPILPTSSLLLSPRNHSPSLPPPPSGLPSLSLIDPAAKPALVGSPQPASWSAPSLARHENRTTRPSDSPPHRGSRLIRGHPTSKTAGGGPCVAVSETVKCRALEPDLPMSCRPHHARAARVGGVGLAASPARMNRWVWKGRSGSYSPRYEPLGERQSFAGWLADVQCMESNFWPLAMAPSEPPLLNITFTARMHFTCVASLPWPENFVAPLLLVDVEFCWIPRG